MISGFISGYKVTGNSTFLENAQKAVSFIENNLKIVEEVNEFSTSFKILDTWMITFIC